MHYETMMHESNLPNSFCFQVDRQDCKDIVDIVLAQCEYKKLIAKVHQSCKGMHDKIMMYTIVSIDGTSVVEYRLDKAFEQYLKL